MIDVRKLVKVADIADRESSMLASTMRRSNIMTLLNSLYIASLTLAR